MIKAIVTLFFFAVLIAATGCQTGGSFAITSEEEPGAIIKSGFESGIYRMDGKSSATILLFDGPAEQPTQAMTIRVLWQPRVARTPLDAEATNATIRHVVFAGSYSDSVGIYSGAGFLYPNTRLGGRSLSVSVWQAKLRLSDASDGFEAPLGHLRLKGRFTVRRDDQAVLPALRQLCRRTSEHLGYPQYVRAYDRACWSAMLR